MITQSIFDRLSDGREVDCYTLQNRCGMTVRLLTIGAAVQGVWLPDSKGEAVPVALGYDTAELYLHTPTYAGTICGRVANRIAGAQFSLNGQVYELPANDGRNQLHGGAGGFFQRIWHAEQVKEGVRFSLDSEDGDQGYPGNMHVAVTYTLSEDNRLTIQYETSCDQDTLCNLTNHCYWNLAGYGIGDALSQTVQIYSDFFTPIDQEVLPTGEIAPVRGPFDLREGQVIAQGKCSDDPQVTVVGGYDHNFVLRDYVPGELRCAVCLRDPASGRSMEIYTTMPGIQFYSGKELPEGHTGVALETQFFPNAMKYWWFPSIVLRADALWKSRTEYRFQLG